MNDGMIGWKWNGNKGRELNDKCNFEKEILTNNTKQNENKQNNQSINN